MPSRKNARKNATQAALTADDECEAEITCLQGQMMADARVDALVEASRVTVETAASETVTPSETVNEGPVSAADVPPASTNDESAFEAGEFVIPDGRALAHAFVTVTDDTFAAVCGRSFSLTGAIMAGALSDRCAYCEDGTEAPADVDDEPATLKPRASRTVSEPVTVTDPEHVSQLASMLASLTAYVDGHGNGADARAFIAAMQTAIADLKPLTKRDRSRPASTSDGETTRTYVRVMPTGRVSVTLNLDGETVAVASMGDACRKLAECMPSAEKCAAYVKRVDVDKLTANARVYLQADIDAGHIPANVVTFGTK